MMPDYSKLQELLDSSLPHSSLAALHGLITGLLTSGAPGIDEEDIATMMECEFSPLVAQLVDRLINNTREQLQDTDYSFQLLLPSDDKSLIARVQALGHWCENFTNGFSAGFVEADSVLGEEGREALADIAQFASLSDELEDDIDDEEGDYMELVEYVRMATMTLFQCLAPLQRAPADASHAPDDGSSTLH